MQIHLGEFVLHLSEHHGDACPGSTVFVRVRGLAEYHAELIAKQYRFLRPGMERGHGGSLCMEVLDPFGNRIELMEPREAAEPDVADLQRLNMRQRGS